MRIEYVSLFVQDIQRSEMFYQKYFRAKEDWISTDKHSCLLKFSDDVRLELLKNAALARAIENDGYECSQHLEKTKDGRYRAIVLDPDKNELELVEEN